ncbi:unnamed protein product [Cladocopium goreaui]|uniref:Uncharacterized protein n=1 Tax=Cladocopium goreaui TaxID=2562237 RepID=A0A9P1CRY5_9DINO|nr:unnamed protein product [Cladocopium goreaui]
MFGASQRVATCFMDRGFPAKALDFLLSPEQDILSRRGWYLYLDHLLMMTFGQLIVCGPPCSLYVWISRGTHQRSTHGHSILGDVSLLSVRMSNAIVHNFAWLLKKIYRVRPLYWVVEQPTSSQMFSHPSLKPALKLWKFSLVTTWLGCFGHILWKGTKLATNLQGGAKLKRKMTAAQKKAIAQRKKKEIEAAKVAGKKQPCYYRKDADGRVTGGRDLASTAKYPVQFCARIFALWYVEFDKMSSKDWHP